MTSKPRPMSGSDADLLIANRSMVRIETRYGWGATILITNRDGQYISFSVPALKGLGGGPLYDVMAWQEVPK